MIVEALVTAVLAVLTGLLSLLPEWELPAFAADFGSSLGGMLAWANGYFPLTHLGVCVGIYFSARIAFSVFAVLRWLYDRIPLKAT